MNTFIIACDVLREEFERLLRGKRNPPQITFLEQGLHDYPDVLRGKFQAVVDTLEKENTGPLTILCGYGLCGRGLSGVQSSRATLVIPRVHDCIPLLLGVEQRKANDLSAGGTYWLSPGWLRCSLIPFHLESHKRFLEYEKKFGTAAAKRLLAIENDWLKNYTKACHIRWPEMNETYVEDAKTVANSIPLPYFEVEGSSAYLAELLDGGKDPDKFLHLKQNQTVDLNTDGMICAVLLETGTG